MTGCTTLVASQVGYSLGSSLRPPPPPGYGCIFESNGCGPSGVLGLLIPDCPMPGICFSDFCAGHDLCYATCGADKENCDEQFYNNMRFLCGVRFDEGDPQLATCEGFAYIYWQVVVRFGNAFYVNTQEIGCVCEDLGGIILISKQVQPLLELAGPSIDGVAPFDDVDDDLLPDDWEVAFGCDPGDPADALTDYDGDGLVNLQEFLFGTDPRQVNTDWDGQADRPFDVRIAAPLNLPR